MIETNDERHERCFDLVPAADRPMPSDVQNFRCGLYIHILSKLWPKIWGKKWLNIR